MPLLVTSLDPSVKFAERCETVSVSSHGCRLRAARAIEPGAKLRLDILHTDRTTAASVVHCEPMGPMAKLWEISLELEKAENFWGIQFPPQDWAASALTKERPSPDARAPSTAATAAPPHRPAPQPPPAAATPPRVTPPKKEEPAPAPTVRTPAQAAVPPRPAAPTQRYPAAPTGVDQTTQDLERLWREKAKAIAAEFEDSYRQSLGDLLVRLRADLEERAAADWERLRQQTLQEIEPRAQQVLEQIEQESEQRRRHATEAETKLQAFRQLQEKVEEQLRTVGDTVQEQVAQEREQLLARTREELEKLEAEVRRQVDQEQEQRTQDAAALRGQLEEIHQVRDYVESLIRLLPQTVDQRVQDGIATTLDHIRARMEEEFTTQREAQGEQLERHLFRLADQTGADLRQKLLEDLDRQQRELLDRVEVRLEEVRALETNLRQYAGQMGSELAGKSEQLRSELGGRLDQQAARHQQAFTARVEEYTGQLNQRAENTLRNLGGQVWTSLKQQLEEEFGRRQQELRQNLETAQTETARLEARAEKLTAKLDTGVEERLERALAGTLQRAHEQLQQASESAQQTHRAAFQEQLDRTLAPLASRGEATADDLRNLIDLLQKEHARLESRAAETRREAEETRAALQAHLEEASSGTLQRAREQLQQASESAQQTHRAAFQEQLDCTLAPLAGRSETTANDLRSLLAAVEKERHRLEEALANTLEHARQQLEEASTAARETHLAVLREQLDRTVGSLVSRGEVTADDLRNLLNSIQQDSARFETQATAFRQESEQTRTWLAQETQQFQKLVHDALIETSGQIKGRLHQAVEMASEPLERTAGAASARLEEVAARKTAELAQQLEEAHQRLSGFHAAVERAREPLDRTAREASSQLEEMSVRKTAEMEQQLEEARQRLGGIQDEVEASLSSMLDARLANVLRQFEEEVEKLAQSSAAQLQANLNEALASVSRIFREKLGPSS